MLKLRVDEILEEQGHTKYWLHKQMGGMSYQNLNKIIMNHTKAIHYDTLEKISDILDCPIGDLFKRVDTDKSK